MKLCLIIRASWLDFFLNHTKSRPSNYMTAREAFCEKISSIFWRTFFGQIFLCRPFPYSLPSGSSALPLQRGRQPEFGVSERLGHFKNHMGLSRFFSIKMFYPPKGVCFADSHRGPIVFTLHFIGVGRGTQDSKSYWAYRIFFCENVLL